MKTRIINLTLLLLSVIVYAGAFNYRRVLRVLSVCPEEVDLLLLLLDLAELPLTLLLPVLSLTIVRTHRKPTKLLG